MFSSLALTQALPFLPLAQGDIDYQVERREDPTLIESVLQEASTRVILTRNGLIGVPKHQKMSMTAPIDRMRLATLPGSYVAQIVGQYPHVIPMFLGTYTGVEAGSVIALDISNIGKDEQKIELQANAADEAFDEPAQTRSASLLETAIERFDWVDLRVFVPQASAREIGQVTTMLSLANWFAYQQYCPHCGANTEPAMSGWAQRCTNADDGNRLLFPRVEPAVIMTVVDAQDRLLIQHNAAWKDPLLYSVSAGFVEAGENLEHAARRETLEETGITVGEVKYVGSQPWPFKISLMTGFKGQALSTDIHVDGEEVTDARWVTRDEFTDLMINDKVHTPGKATIARYMIEEWYGREIE